MKRFLLLILISMPGFSQLWAQKVTEKKVLEYPFQIHKVVSLGHEGFLLIGPSSAAPMNSEMTFEIIHVDLEYNEVRRESVKTTLDLVKVYVSHKTGTVLIMFCEAFKKSGAGLLVAYDFNLHKITTEDWSVPELFNFSSVIEAKSHLYFASTKTDGRNKGDTLFYVSLNLKTLEMFTENIHVFGSTVTAYGIGLTNDSSGVYVSYSESLPDKSVEYTIHLFKPGNARLSHVKKARFSTTSSDCLAAAIHLQIESDSSFIVTGFIGMELPKKCNWHYANTNLFGVFVAKMDMSRFIWIKKHYYKDLSKNISDKGGSVPTPSYFRGQSHTVFSHDDKTYIIQDLGGLCTSSFTTVQLGCLEYSVFGAVGMVIDNTGNVIKYNGVGAYRTKGTYTVDIPKVSVKDISPYYVRVIVPGREVIKYIHLSGDDFKSQDIAIPSHNTSMISYWPVDEVLVKLGNKLLLVESQNPTGGRIENGKKVKVKGGTVFFTEIVK